MIKKYNIVVKKLKNTNIILTGQPKSGKTFLNEVVSSMVKSNILNMDFFLKIYIFTIKIRIFLLKILRV